MADSDDKIIRLCREGDRRAFDLLVEHYGKSLYSFAYRFIRNHQAADEILQETFISVFLDVRKFEPTASFRGWIYRIAHNKCIDTLKMDTRRKAREALYEERREDARRLRNNTEISAFGHLESAGIAEAMDALPERQRSAICLFAVCDFPIKEIAKIMACSEGTVMSHLHRARNALRERLAGKDLKPREG